MVMAVVPDADHPTRRVPRTLTRTLWGDQCLDAVACEASINILIWPTRMLCSEGLQVYDLFDRLRGGKTQG